MAGYSQLKFMGPIPNNEAWQIFFDFYRGLPELWDSRSILYQKNRTRKRNQAFERLLDVYQMICPNATFEDLKKRIINIKHCYKMEVTRKEEEERKGNPYYVSNLWYFDHVDFLGYPEAQLDPETQQSGVVEVNDDGQILVNKQPIHKDTSEYYPHTRAPITYKESKKRLQSYLENMSDAEREEYNKMGNTYLIFPENDRKSLTKNHSQPEITQTRQRPKDEASAYATSWAASFRNLSDMQKIYAKKAIEDVLVLGQLDCLCMNTVDVISATGNAPNH